MSELFDDAYSVNEQLDELYKEKDSIRRSLRNLRDAKKLNPDQQKELKELFPEVKRNRKKGKDTKAA